MHTNTAQYGVVAKRRLPSDFHTPVPLIPPAARINGTRRIRRATSVAVLPSVKLYKTAGKVSAALSPDKNPLAVGSLPVVRPKSNSRFFTDCYHQPPQSGRVTVAKRACWGVCHRAWRRQTGVAAPARDRDRVGKGRPEVPRLGFEFSALRKHQQTVLRHRAAAPAVGAGTAAATRRGGQFACRRRKAGMSSWSSSRELCTGACRPSGSRP